MIHEIGKATQYFYANSDDRHYQLDAVFFLAEFEEGQLAPERAEFDLVWLPVANAEKDFFHQCHAWAVQSADRDEN
jgi:hypothetical protein